MQAVTAKHDESVPIAPRTTLCLIRSPSIADVISTDGTKHRLIRKKQDSSDQRSEPLIYNSWCSDASMGGTGSFNQTGTSRKLVLLAIKTPLESLHLGIPAFFQPDVAVLQGNIPPCQFLSA